MSASDYFEDVALDALFDVAGYYLLVSTADPTDDESGLAEPSGGSYARVAIASDAWNAASGGDKTNADAFEFPAATGDWGTLTYFAIADAETDGNLIVSGALTASKAIDTGQTLSFPASSITISLD
jgi:hypothetical protein